METKNKSRSSISNNTKSEIEENMIFGKKTEEEILRKELKAIIEAKKKGKEINEKNLERVLELSKAWNKQRLLNNFIEKLEVFYTYDDAEEFPVNPWVDSFLEK